VAYHASQVIRLGLETDSLDDLLVVNPKREPFRRLVR